MTRHSISCANEYCMFDFTVEGELPEFPYCDWCMQRKLLQRTGLESQRKQATHQLRMPWKGYSWQSIPSGIRSKYAAADVPGWHWPISKDASTVSPTAPVRPPSTKGGKGKANAQTAVSAADATAAKTQDNASEGFAKQLRNARLNVDRIKGQDEAAEGLRQAASAQVKILEQALKDSQSLAEQVKDQSKVVDKCQAATHVAESNRDSARTTLQTCQKTYDQLAAQEADARQELQELQARLQTEEDEAKIRALASPLKRTCCQLPDTLPELVSAFRAMPNKSLCWQFFEKLAEDASTFDGFNIQELNRKLMLGATKKNACQPQDVLFGNVPTQLYPEVPAMPGAAASSNAPTQMFDIKSDAGDPDTPAGAPAKVMPDDSWRRLEQVSFSLARFSRLAIVSDARRISRPGPMPGRRLLM